MGIDTSHCCECCCCTYLDVSNTGAHLLCVNAHSAVSGPGLEAQLGSWPQQFSLPSLMALFATRKLGKEGSVVLAVLPWCTATLMVLLWLSSSARPSVSQELQLMRQELADQYAAAAAWSNKHLHHRTPLMHHAAADTPWQLTATCNSSLEHAQLLEKLLQPKAFLNHLVQQKSKTWLQIGR